MRQAGSDDKGPNENLGSEIENAQSNHGKMGEKGN